MILDRRAWLAGTAAALICPRAGAAGPAALLDRAARLPPVDALALLDGATAAAPGARLDLATARAGLAIDAALVRLGAPTRDALKAWGKLRAGARGLAADPDGAAIHALLAGRSAGTIDLAEAERRLRMELAALHRQARRLFDRSGRWRGTVGASFAALWGEERYLYPDDRAGRDAAVRDMNADLARFRAVAASLIGPVPEASLVASIRALSPEEVAAGRGGYRDQSAGRPGGYVVDLKDVRRRPSWTLPSVVAHETVPGHLVQESMEEAAPPHPLRIEYAAAFVEGWAIHAETLVPIGDVPGQLGRTHWLLFRTCRALADLGIHRHGWSLDEAHARLVAWQGVPVYFAPFETEIPRIVQEPGNRIGEAVMWLRIADRVRHRSRADRRAIHHRLLLNGRKRIEAVAEA